MINYLINTFFSVVISFSVIYFYYTSGHSETANILPYLGTIAVIYGVYKFIKTIISGKKVSFSPAGIAGYTLINLFVLCVIFFQLDGGTGSLFLFFKIIGFLALPFLITFIIYNFGLKLLSFINGFLNEDSSFKFLMSLGLGFTSFFFLITIAAILGQYNLYAVFGILIIFLGISIKEFYSSIISFFNYKIEFDNHDSNGSFFDTVNLKLLSSEFSFIILSFLAGVNFINIVRPMPIGWDDLGAYMNMPQMLARAGEILPGNGMYSWQILTGIGFMFKSATQAFFINQIGGILSVIVLIVAFSFIFKSSKKTLLNIPLLLSVMFYAMPMVIFQQAKDMKLDTGLFFMSVIGIFAIYYLFSKFLGYEEIDSIKKEENYSERKENSFVSFTSKIVSVFKSSFGESDLFDKKSNLIYLFIIGIIVGSAFSIKVTTLMLILGVIGVIFYSKIGFSGFLAYFFLFVGIFTKFKLWDYLNVSYPKDNIVGINNVAYAFIGVGVGLFFYAFFKYGQKAFSKVFILLVIFSLGVAVPLSPWIVKNYSELQKDGVKVSIGGLLNGNFSGFNTDYSKIYTKEELKKIEEASVSDGISSQGKSGNEDLGRYFGYENGINNYLKLPWNLTMQKNQSGEYTDLTYFYLAFLPVLFLFFPFRRKEYKIGAYLIILAFGLYFLPGSSSDSITAIFSKILLPEGYIYIVSLALVILAYFIYTINHSKIGQIAKLNFIFAIFYTLIFVIAAYGIVWYGIAMYFTFLLMIGIGFYYISEIKEDDSEDTLSYKLFASFFVLLLVGVYFVRSSIPHGISNLSAASFSEYKAGTLNQEEAIFTSHPDYFAILSELNLKDKNAFAKNLVNNLQDKNLSQIINQNFKDINIIKLEEGLRQIRDQDLSNSNIPADIQITLKSSAKNLLNELYNGVLYPSKDQKNEKNIYRIGTFLTYFITDNRSRYYDDSLVTNFPKYFYNTDSNLAIDRMKKLGLSYLLVDLNAATIDKDPRHDLTARYEKLLSSFKSDKLELIQSDSICLKIALDEKASNYMEIAGVNYESYDKDGKQINRGQKQLACYNHILDLMKNNKISSDNYPYLLPLKNYIESKKITDQNTLVQVFQQFVNHGWMALFRIK